MDTKLSRIAEVAKTRPKERFTSLAHLLDKQMLGDCHLELPADKASGIDEVTKAEYQENLETNLDDWVARMKRQAYKPQPSRRTYIPKDEKGKAAMVRFADDFVCCFEREGDAKAFYDELIERLKKFNLSIAEEKTKIIRFGRDAQRECAREGRRKPIRVKEFTEFIRRNRHMKENELVKKVSEKLNGHYQYYGVSDNFERIEAYYRTVLFLIRKWRNRRGQKRSFTIDKFDQFVERNTLPLPRIKVNLFESKV